MSKVLNCANTPVDKAIAYAQEQCSADGKSMAEYFSDFKTNYLLLQDKCDLALDLPRIEMPVIEPEQMDDFQESLSQGHIDVKEPVAKTPQSKSKYPTDLGFDLRGRQWLYRGTRDGAIEDDILDTQMTEIAVADLKPSQSQIWLEKVVGMSLYFGPLKQSSEFLHEAPIIVSSDGYILDGHHRFGAAMVSNPSLKLTALKVDMEIRELVKMARSYGNAIGNEQKAAESFEAEYFKRDGYDAETQTIPSTKVVVIDGEEYDIYIGDLYGYGWDGSQLSYQQYKKIMSYNLNIYIQSKNGDGKGNWLIGEKRKGVEDWLKRKFNPKEIYFDDDHDYSEGARDDGLVDKTGNIHTIWFSLNNKVLEFFGIKIPSKPPSKKDCSKGHTWSNAYIRNDYGLEDDGTASVEYGQRCEVCDVERRGSIGGDVSWDMDAESFEAEMDKVVDVDCVNIVSKKSAFTGKDRNFYRVSFRDSGQYDRFGIPAWASKAAKTMGEKYYGVSGCQMVMGMLPSGKWQIQAILIPNTEKMNKQKALKIANHMQDRIEKEGKWAKKKCREDEIIQIYQADEYGAETFDADEAEMSEIKNKARYEKIVNYMEKLGFTMKPYDVSFGSYDYIQFDPPFYVKAPNGEQVKCQLFYNLAADEFFVEGYYYNNLDYDENDVPTGIPTIKTMKDKLNTYGFHNLYFDDWNDINTLLYILDWDDEKGTSERSCSHEDLQIKTMELDGLTNQLLLTLDCNACGKRTSTSASLNQGWDAETFNAMSFNQWSQDEMNEELHGGRNMQFKEWLDDEVHTHGNIPLKEWGYEEEHDEPEHQHAETFNADVDTETKDYWYDNIKNSWEGYGLERYQNAKLNRSMKSCVKDWLADNPNELAYMVQDNHEINEEAMDGDYKIPSKQMMKKEVAYLKSVFRKVADEMDKNGEWDRYSHKVNFDAESMVRKPAYGLFGLSFITGILLNMARKD